MGYCMDYRRVIRRNGLMGDYMTNPEIPDAQRPLSQLRGDLRRLETDQRDEMHLRAYAQRAGITAEQVKAVLDALFDDRGCVHFYPDGHPFEHMTDGFRHGSVWSPPPASHLQEGEQT